MNNSKSKFIALIWLLIVILLLGYNAYLWFDKRITPNTDILALLPAEQRDPVLQQAFDHMVDTAQQRIIVLVGATDWTQAVRAADAYSAVISTRPDLLTLNNFATEKIQNDWLTTFAKGRLNLLTPDQQIALHTQPASYWVDTALRNLYSPFAAPKLGAWQDDPFGLFSTWGQARAQETPVRPRDGKLFVADKDRSYVLLIMNLHPSAFSMTAQTAVMPLLALAATAAQKTVPQSEIISSGVVLHAAIASQQARHEMSTIGIGSLLGIILLTWLTFRSLKPILLIASSLMVGCLGALAICWLILGQIHLLTLVFGASLIGIAQDYGIYFLCGRLREDKAASAAMDSTQLLRYLWPGLYLTLAAAIVGYMGLALTPFPALRQMALFSGVGLLFAWLTVLCWFPVLVQPHTLTITRFANQFAASRAHWPLLQKNKITFFVILLFFVFALIGWSRLTVNDDIRTLQKPPQLLIDNDIKISKLLDAPTLAQFYLVRGATPEIVLQREEALAKQLQPLIEQHIISGYQAISNWIPSLQTQTANQKLIAQKILTQPLQDLAVKIGEDNTWVTTIKNRTLAATTLLTPDDFLKTSASEPWRYLWLGKVGDEYASIVALRGLNNYSNLPILQQTANKINGIQWVDKIGDISSILGHYRQYMGWVIVCAYAAIYGLLYWRYRRHAWRVLMPPAVASMATLALFGLFGIPLQLFHVLAFMLILGLGVDYGIFLQEQADRHEGFAWLAVGLSAVSALLSFGLLSLSKTPPLHAFGLTMLIGMSIVWLIAPCFMLE